MALLIVDVINDLDFPGSEPIDALRASDGAQDRATEEAREKGAHPSHLCKRQLRTLTVRFSTIGGTLPPGQGARDHRSFATG